MAAIVAGCGGSTGGPGSTAGSAAAPGPGARTVPAPTAPRASPARPAAAAAAADTAVIRRWAAALRAGRISKATSAFALPVVVSNSGPPITLRSADEVAVFNITLPCGARVVRVLDVGRYVTATFELTARRGPGAGCGAGVGQRAHTAFLIRNGRIAAWRRVGAPDGRPSRGAPRLPGRTPPPGTQAA